MAKKQQDYRADDAKHPLAPIVREWLSKIGQAVKHKRRVFTDDADEAMMFFNGPHTAMFDNKYATAKKGGYHAPQDEANTEEIVPPSFRMQVNKVSEVRDLFGPALYHQNPAILVNPLEPPPPPPQALGIFTPPPDNQPPIMTPMGPQPAPPSPQQMMFQQQMMQYQMMQQQEQDKIVVRQYVAKLMQYMLDYCQREFDKKTEARLALDEVLVKGWGVMWTEIVEREGFQSKFVASFYDSCDNLVLDPDAERRSDILWAARKRTESLRSIEKKFHLPEGYLKDKGTDESNNSVAKQAGDPDAKDKRNRGKTYDLGTYWEVYSKMGFAVNYLKESANNDLARFDGSFDELGPFIYLAVMDGVKHPLNLPDELLESEPVEQDQEMMVPPGMEDDTEQFSLPRTPVMETVMQPVADPMTGQPAIDPMSGQPQQQPVEQQATDPETGEPQTEIDPQIAAKLWWPIPFWGLENGWPFEDLGFRKVMNQVYPMPYIKPAIGELRFINWAMSFLASKIRRSCLTTVAINKAAGDEFVQGLLSGKDFNVIEIEQLLGKNISEIVSVLEYPEVNTDIWKMVEAVMNEFMKRTGLNELMYGQSATQDRSAAESNIKENATQIRPDDMANQTEDWLSRIAAKEAMAMHWFMEGQDVAPVLGDVGAQAWDQYVRTTSVEAVCREFSYRIEAGSARKPNKRGKSQAINEAAQSWGQFLENYAMKSGDVGPINAMMQAWGEANDIPMPMLQPPPPPPPEPPPGSQPPGGPAPKQQQQGAAA